MSPVVGGSPDAGFGSNARFLLFPWPLNLPHFSSALAVLSASASVCEAARCAKAARQFQSVSLLARVDLLMQTNASTVVFGLFTGGS